MIITVNGQSLEAGGVVGENLEEILTDLQNRYLPPDHAVGQVLVNGQSYSEDLPHAAVEIGREDIQTLEIVLLTPEEIAQHFLKHGPGLLDTMLTALPRITEMFRLGDESEANEHYLRFLESLHLLVQMLEQSGQVLGLHFGLAVGSRESLDDRMERLSKTLSLLLSVQEQTDWVYLADILEYELTPELEALRDMLGQLRGAAH